MVRYAIVLVLLSASGLARADHPAGVFAQMCERAYDKNEPDDPMRAICRSKVEGFIDGYRLSVKRLPVKGKKCYPENSDVDQVTSAFIYFMSVTPQAKDTNYSIILKTLVDKMYPCATS